MKKVIIVHSLMFAALFFIMGCEGDQGPAGPEGPSGPAGPKGDTGEVVIPTEYTNANSYPGGAAYAKWYTTDAGGSGDAGITVSADFARCKACHAWDGLGNAASYANRTGQSTGKDSRCGQEKEYD